MRKCKICGRMFEPKYFNTQMCSAECVAAARKISNAKTNERVKKERRERLGIRICVECGVEFAPSRETQVCCNSICQHERIRKIEKSWREEAKKKDEKTKKKADTLAEINAKARAAGMTYGKYMEYISGRKEPG